MFTRDPDASFDTPNVVIGRQDRNELTLSFRPDPYLSTLLESKAASATNAPQWPAWFFLLVPGGLGQG